MGLRTERFIGVREAMDFLVDQIATEAQREGKPLTETERKMLYFSETGWTLPEMAEVNDRFDREYDQEQYERKIRRLIYNARSRFQKQDQEGLRLWADAVRMLRKEDRYLFVMLDAPDAKVHPSRDLVRLWAWGFVIVGIIVTIGGIYSNINLSAPKFPVYSFWIVWGSATGGAIAYSLLRPILGTDQANQFVTRLIPKFFFRGIRRANHSYEDRHRRDPRS
jgi:hypothetical protein